MKWISTLIILVALSACSTSQKYSNSRYQEANNTDDAYFSPSDLKKKNKKVAVTKPSTENSEDESIEKYKVQGGSYYDNTHDETANPNASGRTTNYQQYTQSSNTTTTLNNNINNANSLQLPQRTTMNMYNQPNWGWGLAYSPFTPGITMGASYSYSSWNGSWYMGSSPYGPGWTYNPWVGWTYNPWTWSRWGNCPPGYNYNPYYGYNSWNVYNSPWIYDPWYNQWVYNPWGWNTYNYWGYNAYNPYYSSYNPYNNNYNNNWWNGGGNGNNNNNNNVVTNRTRRPSNTFMPAVRNANPGGVGSAQGGSHVIAATEMTLPPPNVNYVPAGTPQQNQGTFSNRNINVGTPNPNNGTVNAGSGSNQTPMPAPAVNRSTPPPATTNPSVQQPRSPAPAGSNPGNGIFSPRNTGGSSGSSGSGGGGGTSGGGRRRK